MSDAALIRIANALERMSPAPLEAPDVAEAEAFLWHTSPDQLEPIAKVSRVEFDLLVGMPRAKRRVFSSKTSRDRSMPTSRSRSTRDTLAIGSN